MNLPTHEYHWRPMGDKKDIFYEVPLGFNKMKKHHSLRSRKGDSVQSETGDSCSSSASPSSNYESVNENHNRIPSTLNGSSTQKEPLFNKHKNRVSRMKAQLLSSELGTELMGTFLKQINGDKMPQSPKVTPVPRKNFLARETAKSSKVTNKNKAPLLCKSQTVSQKMAKNLKSSERQWAHMNNDKNSGSAPKPEKCKGSASKQNTDAIKKIEKAHDSAVMLKSVNTMSSNGTFDQALAEPSAEVPCKRKRGCPRKNNLQEEATPVKKPAQQTKKAANRKKPIKEIKRKGDDEAIKVKTKFKRIRPLISDSEESDEEFPNISKCFEPCDLLMSEETILNGNRQSTASSSGFGKNLSEGLDVNLYPCQNALEQHIEYADGELCPSTPDSFPTNTVPRVQRVSQIDSDTAFILESPSSKENVPVQSIVHGETVSIAKDKSPTNEAEIINLSDDDDVLIIENVDTDEEDVTFIEEYVKPVPPPLNEVQTLFNVETEAKKNKELAEEIKVIMASSDTARAAELIRKIDASSKSNVCWKYY